MKFFSQFTNKIKSFWGRFVVWVKPPRPGARSEEPAITTPFLISEANTDNGTTPSLSDQVMQKQEVSPLSETAHKRQSSLPMRFWNSLFFKKNPPVEEPLNAQVQTVLTQVLEPYLSLQDRDTFTKTSSIFRQDWLPHVRREKLMHRVLWNNQKEVKALLEQAKTHPERLTDLLCKPVVNEVTELSGKSFKERTPFQAALCTGNEILCELFKSYFEQIPGGLEAMQTQIKAIFPEGIEAHIEKQKKEALKFKEETLRPLITTISAASATDVKTMLSKKQADSELGQAIRAFREKIKDLSINNKKDPVSNPFYLQEAFHLYDECFNTFTTWDQRDLFCIQGIGYVQCYSPARDLQAFAQGLYYLVEERKPFLGSFKFTHAWNSVTHLEIKMKDFRSLGFDYWGGGGVGGARTRVPLGLGAGCRAARILEIFIKQKQQALLQILCGDCR